MAAVECAVGCEVDHGLPQGHPRCAGIQGLLRWLHEVLLCRVGSLHEGFFEFWESSRAWADRVAVTIDLFVHLALWFVALSLESG